MDTLFPDMKVHLPYDSFVSIACEATGEPVSETQFKGDLEAVAKTLGEQGHRVGSLRNTLIDFGDFQSERTVRAIYIEPPNAWKGKILYDSGLKGHCILSPCPEDSRLLD